jgi:hypothetical protein
VVMGQRRTLNKNRDEPPYISRGYDSRSPFAFKQGVVHV